MTDNNRIDDEPTDEELYGELARRLSLAYTSCHARVAYSTLERRFRGEPPGSYWLELAKRVTEEVMSHGDESGPRSSDVSVSHGRGDN
jgi:hypothetical protein